MRIRGVRKMNEYENTHTTAVRYRRAIVNLEQNSSKMGNAEACEAEEG